MSLPNILDLAGLALGFIFTIMVFTYLLGDNALFRISIYIFIGVAAAFTLVSAVYTVFINQMLFQVIQKPGLDTYLLVIPPLLFGLLLWSKASARLNWLGNPVMAYLVGVGAATAIGGAVLGTIFPQIGATATAFDLTKVDLLALIRAAIILLGTVVTLIYFHFGVRQAPDLTVHRPAWVEQVIWLGQTFIAIALGALFAGVYSASLTALVERLSFLSQTVLRYIHF